MDLRIGVTDDPSLLAEIHFHTVSFAYREFFPTGSRPPGVSELSAQWADRLADESACALAGSLQGEPVGAVAVRQDPAFDAQGQLLGLHVLPAHWGLGFGGALHDRALEILRARGHAEAGLWVIEVNDRARQLYEERGWTFVPNVDLHLLGIREVRYHKAL